MRKTYQIESKTTGDQFATVEATSAKEAMAIWTTKLWHQAPNARGLRARLISGEAIILTNSFHGTQIAIRANVGDTVSRATLRRVHKHLCGISDCTCGREDGTRDSRYYLESQGYGATATVLVVDGRER